MMIDSQPVTSINLAPVNIIHIIYSTMAIFSILLVFGKKPYKALALLLVVHAIQEQTIRSLSTALYPSRLY